jgi:hypothetical protein
MTVEPPANSIELSAWCLEGDLPAGRLEGVNDVQKSFAIAVATDLLYVLSGRQYRSGRVVVRPSSIQGAASSSSYLYPYSSMSGYGEGWGFAGGWSWSTFGQGWWQNGQDLAECVLQGPIRAINSVLVDGQELGPWPPPNPNYTLYDRRRLVRNIGIGAAGGSWPWSQQLQLPVTSPGTWQIDYEWGRNPPPAGKAACIALAVEVARSLSGSDSSQLPERVVSLASQGVTMQVGDALNYIREELTGLPIVDMFLTAVNPAKLRRRSVFIAPNTIQGREVS